MYLPVCECFTRYELSLREYTRSMCFPAFACLLLCVALVSMHVVIEQERVLGDSSIIFPLAHVALRGELLCHCDIGPILE